MPGSRSSIASSAIACRLAKAALWRGMKIASGRSRRIAARASSTSVGPCSTWTNLTPMPSAAARTRAVSARSQAYRAPRKGDAHGAGQRLFQQLQPLDLELGPRIGREAGDVAAGPGEAFD